MRVSIREPIGRLSVRIKSEIRFNRGTETFVTNRHNCTRHVENLEKLGRARCESLKCSGVNFRIPSHASDASVAVEWAL